MHTLATVARLLAACILALALIGCTSSDDRTAPPSPELSETPAAAAPTVTSSGSEDPTVPDGERVPYQLTDFDCSKTERWVDGVDLLVFFDPEAPASFIATIESELESLGFVERIRFRNKEQAFLEFLEMFANTGLEDTISVDDVMPRFDIWLTEPSRGLATTPHCALRQQSTDL